MHTFVSATTGKVARLIVAAAALAAAAQSAPLATLYSFTGGANGANPTAGVVFGANGSLFGTTPYGGSDACQGGCGTIFELTPGTPWTQTVLYSFQGGSDGANPGAALTLGTGGVFYGTTAGGGNSGNGTVFKLTPPAKTGGAWTETVLYSFQGNVTGTVNVTGTGTEVTLTSGSPFVTGTTWNGLSIVLTGVTYTVASVQSASRLTLTLPAPLQTNADFSTNDGSGPLGSVAMFPNGKLYGTTFAGGAPGLGTIFELTPPNKTGRWTETVLYVFQGGKDGWGPESGPVVYKGNLYGTTCCGTVGGTAFELAQTKGGGWSKKAVYGFSGYSIGANPVGGLAVDSNGVLYGTTIEGGGDGSGVVFSLTPPVTKGASYILTTIHTFTGGADGGAPYGTLLLGSSGQIYATVTVGCAYTVGGVLEFTPPVGGTGPWTETVLYNFTGGADGAQPYGGVVLNNNALYGTTAFSSDGLGYGTVFQLPL